MVLGASVPFRCHRLGRDLQLLGTAKQRGQTVKRNAGASLVDLGDGVLAVEFHSKLNTIGGDTVGMLTGGVREASERFDGLVVGNDAVNFCAGANLMLVLLEAQEGNWDEIDLMVRGFQQAILGLRYSPVPVVVAPAGLALGGGCEMVLHADRVQAAAETYMGQVEVGVGLIPAGCGTKELTVRAVDATARGTDPLPRLQRAFETIGFGTVSTSAADARRLGLLRDVDGVTMNRERLMADAKATVLDRVRDGYRAPATRIRDPGGWRRLPRCARSGHPSGLAGRTNQRPRCADRAQDRPDHDRRRSPALNDGDRAAPPKPGAGGVSEPVRRGTDTGADPPHAQDRQDAAELAKLRPDVHTL